MKTSSTLVSLLENDIRWRYARWLLLGVALWIAVSHIGRLPLENHEVYVIQTAQEMQQRSDWIVPYFNGEPRLNKPPMNYWLTAMTAWASGSEDRIQAWHGRLPSALAGVGLLFLLVRLGASLYGRSTAFLGGLILISSLGYFSYTHNARPDLLYAFFCTAGYSAFAAAREAAGPGTGGRRAALLMWISYGAATLTKGPHLPAMLLTASMVFVLIETRDWRRLAIFRPVSGVLLFAALTLPWWWLLRHQVGEAQLASSQLSGSLLTIDWKRLINPYYLYQTWIMVAPWVLLVPWCIYLIARRRIYDSETLWLLLLIAIPMLFLGLGPQRRWFYMLPVLVPICLLLGRSLAALLEASTAEAPRRWFGGLVLAHWLAAAAFLIWAGLSRQPIQPAEANPRVWLVAALCVTALAAALFYRRFRKAHPATDVVVSTGLVLVFLLDFGATTLFWSADRYYRPRLAAAAAAATEEQTPIATWGINPAVYLYHTRRQIAELHDAEQIASRLNREGSRLILVAYRSDLDRLPGTIRVEPLAAAVDPDEGDEETVALLTRQRVTQ